ncbi:MAG: alpha/beta fold hydrolase [Steroidobacteraceae bacterium]
MSGPLVTLPPAAACAPLTERVLVRDSADGLDAFDLCADSRTVAEALRLAIARPGACRALVIVAAAPPSEAGLVERFAALQVPTLTIFGTRDREIPPETGRRWRALLPACHVVFVYDAAHDPAADRPQAFADLVLDFLAEPLAFLVNRRDGALG